MKSIEQKGIEENRIQSQMARLSLLKVSATCSSPPVWSHKPAGALRRIGQCAFRRWRLSICSTSFRTASTWANTLAGNWSPSKVAAFGFVVSDTPFDVFMATRRLCWRRCLFDDIIKFAIGTGKRADVCFFSSCSLRVFKIEPRFRNPIYAYAPGPGLLVGPAYRSVSSLRRHPLIWWERSSR